MSIQCYKCGKNLPESLKVMVSRSDTCLHCMADIRCCKMCLFYDPNVYNECKEINAARVVDKEKANFCDYYKFSGSHGDAEKQRQDALAKAAALFKK